MRIEKRVRKILKPSVYGAVSTTELREVVTQWLEDIEAGHLKDSASQDYLVSSVEDILRRMAEFGFTDRELQEQADDVIEQMQVALDWVYAGQGGAGQAQKALMNVLAMLK